MPWRWRTARDVLLLPQPLGSCIRMGEPQRARPGPGVQGPGLRPRGRRPTQSSLAQTADSDPEREREWGFLGGHERDGRGRKEPSLDESQKHRGRGLGRDRDLRPPVEGASPFSGSRFSAHEPDPKKKEAGQLLSGAQDTVCDRSLQDPTLGSSDPKRKEGVTPCQPHFTEKRETERETETEIERRRQ